jgi:CheY-like chemotaxis protein
MPNSVLIVDDEPLITCALMTRLEDKGFKVYHAINGLAGVEAAALYEPDVIIMDIRMPDIDGYEACQRIHRMPRLAETPIIFLSANVQDTAIARTEEVGGSRFISKPYNAADVIDALNTLINLPNSEVLS